MVCDCTHIEQKKKERKTQNAQCHTTVTKVKDEWCEQGQNAHTY